MNEHVDVSRYPEVVFDLGGTLLRGTTGAHSLCAAWNENAEDWVRWARSRECDHAFWHLNLPVLLALLPPPEELTLDVGCGEGRVARALKKLGHHVVGIESSPALAQAAKDADPSFEVHVADAASMPLPDKVADLAIASLALMNMDNMPGVVGEIARVLRPGAVSAFRFCIPSTRGVTREPTTSRRCATPRSLSGTASA